MSGVVAFGGSRSLLSSSLVVPAVRSVLAAGRSVSVGCAAGADALVLRAVLAAGAASRLSVFAVGEESGRGFWRCSALSAVRAAARAGASVSWLAGGPLSLPLRVRLFARSEACLSAAVAGGPGSAAVFFVRGGPSVSPGSWSVAAAAVRLGLPLFVFPVGESSFVWPGPSWSRVAGEFVPAAASGVWSAAFRWEPASRLPSPGVTASWVKGSRWAAFSLG